MKLFDLYAGLSLDASEFNNGIKQAASVGESFQGNVTAISAKSVALGHALYDVGKQAVQMAANLAKSVVTEYADTEQLLGGVDGQDPPPSTKCLTPKLLHKYMRTKNGEFCRPLKTCSTCSERRMLMMNSKRKGNRAERELLHLLQSYGLDAYRND